MRRIAARLVCLVACCFCGTSVASTTVTGTINTNTTWSPAGSPYFVTDPVTVARNVTLAINPGTRVRMENYSRLSVSGTIYAVGTDTNMISVTTTGSSDGIMLQGESYSTLSATGIIRHCTFSQVGGYSAGTAVGASYSVLEVRDCIFSNMPASGILPYYSRIVVVGNVLTNLAGQGVRESYCAGIIASNIVSHITVYANAIDLNYMWGGPGDSTIQVIGNILSDGLNLNADGIDTGSVTADIHGNNIWGFGDKGISLGEETHGQVYNNLIRDCVIGIAVKDGSDSILANNTIVDCTYGIRSYYKYGPTGGHSSATNNIVWGCTSSIVNDSSSTLNISYSNIQGGWAGTSNINSNPQFVNPSCHNFNLSASSPCVDTGFHLPGIGNDLDGIPRPLDGNNDGTAAIDMGTYESVHAAADSDADGLRDVAELQTHHTSPVNPDSDGDEMPDGWEVTSGLDPLSGDAYADKDGDGSPNLDEYIAGTGAADPSSRLQITSVSVFPTHLAFTWDSVTQRFYSVMTSTNLGETWNCVTDPQYTNIPGPGIPLTYSNSPPDMVPRFYRLRVSL